MEKALSAGKNRIIDPLEHCNVKYVDLAKSQSEVITNLNTMEDYHRFIGQKGDIDK